MTLVTVVRHVPRPIVGVLGVRRERRFEAFEEELDWLESTGVLVERLDPAELPKAAAAERVFAEEGDRALPLVLVNGIVVSRGTVPTRTQLARLVGRGRKSA